MNRAEKKDFQQKFDVKKWVESEEAGRDKCGEYDFCNKCDKNLSEPCAEANAAARGVSLKESMAMADKGTSSVVNKKFVADYLEETFGDKVETYRRNNTIRSGRLPLADTHYVVGDKKKCFIYVYETVKGGTMFLIKVPADYAEGLKKANKSVYLSAFPKAKTPWYTVIADENLSAEDVKTLLKDLVALNA
ncbi:MAG: hypothetical protein IJ735_02580 [Clostridia bacterium]|nr:hypothetical protein [Clostridia bacterium]